jgi:anti-sigma regulatory factor (Ser/Thr protein kinase)
VNGFLRVRPGAGAGIVLRVKHGILHPDVVHGDGCGTRVETGFCHEAFLYAGRDEFLHGTTAFIRDGLAADEPTLVVVGAEKIALLRAELGTDAADVRFADMAEVGSNPARIIPAWSDFLEERSDKSRPLRGIGEPIGPHRGPVELVECQRHEMLLNLAFEGTPAFWLMCPYDTDALDPVVVDEALRSHPIVSDGRGRADSTSYGGLLAAAAPFREPLREPATQPKEFHFEAAGLAALRQYVALRAAGAGLDVIRTEDLLLTVNEVATNSLRHAHGSGVLRVWEEPDHLICEVRDGGTFDNPLAGRERPVGGQEGGYGLWLANQLCDLVQVRSFVTGTVVRLHMRRG